MAFRRNGEDGVGDSDATTQAASWMPLASAERVFGRERLAEEHCSICMEPLQKLHAALTDAAESKPRRATVSLRVKNGPYNRISGAPISLLMEARLEQPPGGHPSGSHAQRASSVDRSEAIKTSGSTRWTWHLVVNIGFVYRIRLLQERSWNPQQPPVYTELTLRVVTPELLAPGGPGAVSGLVPPPAVLHASDQIVEADEEQMHAPEVAPSSGTAMPVTMACTDGQVDDTNGGSEVAEPVSATADMATPLAVAHPSEQVHETRLQSPKSSRDPFVGHLVSETDSRGGEIPAVRTDPRVDNTSSASMAGTNMAGETQTYTSAFVLESIMAAGMGSNDSTGDVRGLAQTLDDVSPLVLEGYVPQEDGATEQSSQQGGSDPMRAASNIKADVMLMALGETASMETGVDSSNVGSTARWQFLGARRRSVRHHSDLELETISMNEAIQDPDGCGTLMVTMPDCSTSDPPQEVVVLKCGHPFHKPCVAEWLQRSGRCPLCREAIGGARRAMQFLF
eukprot:TRINITY_DN21947_c0_g1_i2.p1 TRINITY_DN21947_c0_g1~~TRINITY_DN21947_c0_g1_i2.p1  ORF type:complete len:586 (-),score=78.52 TRINITY_DN21947_c0_g1_i2:516-2045(-)